MYCQYQLHCVASVGGCHFAVAAFVIVVDADDLGEDEDLATDCPD